jgi:hypothetical protein
VTLSLGSAIIEMRAGLLPEFYDLLRASRQSGSPGASEDPRMAIFDAAAFALASFGLAGRELLQRFSVRHHELP